MQQPKCSIAQCQCNDLPPLASVLWLLCQCILFNHKYLFRKTKSISCDAAAIFVCKMYSGKEVIWNLGELLFCPFFIEQIILSLTKRWYATISTQKIIICCKSKQYLVVMIVSHCGNGNGNVLMVMVMPCGNNYLNLPCGNDCLAAFPNLYQEYLGVGSPLQCSHYSFLEIIFLR